MFKKNQCILLLLSLSSLVFPAAWHIPSAESIRQAISDHKLATYSLAGITACSATTVALLKTDYNAVKMGDPRFYWNWDEINQNV